MKLYDGKKHVEITMHLWDEREANMSPDWSNDFFDAGCLTHDTEREGTYSVNDVEYCIDQANDWKNFVGDFRDDEPKEGLERMVFVDVIQE